MMVIRAAHERGRADFGWLQSAHSFSFGQYYDPRYMGVSALRVINDDRVAAGAGFGTHGHDNMEIISYVVEGTIAHRDSMGNVTHLPAGEFQLMSAGQGLTHSEFNPSATEPLHFLQIWIMPAVRNTEPGYQQQRFERQQAVQPVITPDGRDGTLSIRQDASLSHVRLHGEEARVTLNDRRTAYVHVVRGGLMLSAGGQTLTLQEGDGVAIRAEQELTFSAAGAAEALLFDLP